MDLFRMHPVPRTLRRLARETRAAEIAEAAAVLPLMFMMLLGIFWFGQAFSIYGAITRAAQDGARAGAAPTCSTCSSGSSAAANAVAAVNADLLASKLDPTQIQVPPSPQPSPLALEVRTPAPAVSTYVCRARFSWRQPARVAPGCAAFPFRFNIHFSSGCPSRP